MKISIIITLTASFLLPGCANFTSPATRQSFTETTNWFSYDSSRRGALMIPKADQGKIIYCAEPAPDVALTLVNKLKGSATISNTEITNGEAEITATAGQLAGRTQTVLLAREAFYRLCEGTLNGSISQEVYLTQFNNILDLVKNIAKKEADEAEAAAKTATLKLNTSSAIIKSLPPAVDADTLIEKLNSLK